MDYSLKWTSTAKNDLTEIIKYIAFDNIEIAKEKLKKIKEYVEQIKIFPEKGRIVPELYKENISNYREAIISPWRIIYSIDKEIIHVLAVIDGRRNIEDILMRRQLR